MAGELGTVFGGGVLPPPPSKPPSNPPSRFTMGVVREGIRFPATEGPGAAVAGWPVVLCRQADHPPGFELAVFRSRSPIAASIPDSAASRASSQAAFW